MDVDQINHLTESIKGVTSVVVAITSVVIGSRVSWRVCAMTIFFVRKKPDKEPTYDLPCLK